MTSEVSTDISALLSNTSAQTLILGVDTTGHIVQHDRNAAEILAHPSDALLGVELSSLLAGPESQGALLAGLLSAARSDREGTAVLTLRTGNAWVHALGYHAIAPHVLIDAPLMVKIFGVAP